MEIAEVPAGVLCSRHLGTILEKKRAMNTPIKTIVNPSEPATIYGIVIPTDWDDSGNIIKLAILTYDEGKIIVMPNDRGTALMNCLRKTVQVQGMLRQGNEFQEIEIHTFAVDPGQPDRL